MNITRSVARFVTNYESPGSFVSRLRRRRARKLYEMIGVIHHEKGRVDILDVGGTRSYWNIFPHEMFENLNVHVTLLNRPGEGGDTDDKHFSWREGDGCEMSMYMPGDFDLVHSNSVIEHVGDWGRMMQFANEVRRLGAKYFVQTPNFWFPIEPHFLTPFFHWLPEPVRVRMLMITSLGHYEKATTVDEAVRAVQSARLLNKRMMKVLFQDGQIQIERILFLPKSIIAIKQ